jgi:hypothetical protein
MHPRAYRTVHRVEDTIEPRMMRAIELANARLRESIPYSLIESALEQGDLRKANAILMHINFEDPYVPSAAILKDSVIRGGKVADEETRKING